jgi:hypothetical protein
MKQAAKALTSSLYMVEAQLQPLTLNSVIAAILLYRREKTLAMAEIIEDADFIFNYFKTKLHAKTTMSVPPT